MIESKDYAAPLINLYGAVPYDELEEVLENGFTEDKDDNWIVGQLGNGFYLEPEEIPEEKKSNCSLLKIQVAKENCYVMEGAVASNISPIPMKFYRRGMFRKPLVLIKEGISPEQISLLE